MLFYIIDLSSFNPLDMQMVKSREKWYGEDDHSRWVFKENNLYYKIWNETYIRKNGVKKGIDCGFYDESTVPSLVALIYSEDVCRGYVTKKCEVCEEDTTSFKEVIKNKTKETGFFIYDITDKHIMKIGDKFSLIDLEGVCSLSEYEDIANDRFNASFSSQEYRRFVYELYRNQ